MPRIAQLLACILLATPAFAEDGPELRPQDQSAIETCLQASVGEGTRQEICIGVVQGPCTDQGGGSTYEMLDASVGRMPFGTTCSISPTSACRAPATKRTWS